MSMPYKSLFRKVWSNYTTQLSTMFCKCKACYKQTKQKLMTPVKEVNDSRPANPKTRSNRLQNSPIIIRNIGIVLTVPLGHHQKWLIWGWLKQSQCPCDSSISIYSTLDFCTLEARTPCNMVPRKR